MTDTRPDPRDASPDNGKVRRVPPLAWVILALLVLMIVVGVSQYGGAHVTPSGTVTPQAEASDAVMPTPEADAAATVPAG